MAIFEGFSPKQGAARAQEEAMKLASVHSSLVAHSGITLRESNTSWQSANAIVPRIEKVANGYTVDIYGETFIAENVEAVTGIISAQLLKLGAK